MSEPAAVGRDEIVAILKRIGVKGFDEAFIARCIELNAITQKTLSTLPPPPDKGLEASHVFAPPFQAKCPDCG